MGKEIVIEASPARLIKALSHIGYSLQSSVCDIIDNSISHGKAKNIYVYFDYNAHAKKFQLYIIDDGNSMTSSELENAMKLGSSDENYDPDADLGKFGMGLKTASLAHCKLFSLTAQVAGKPPVIIQMDKNAIEKKDKWVYTKTMGSSAVQHLEDDQNLLISCFPKVRFFKQGESFAMVKWEQLFNLDAKAKRYQRAGARDNWIQKETANLESHIRMVFHRFLNGHQNARKVRIYFNSENPLTGWDPCQPVSEPATIFREKNTTSDAIIFPIEGAKKGISITRYLLPTDKDKVMLTQRSLRDQNLKVDKWQGLYFYRNNRLIDYGGWFDGTGTEPHVTYARAAVDLTSEHDRLFTLDVNKTKINRIDEEFKGWLKKNMEKFRGAAKRRVGSKKKPKHTNSLRKKTDQVNSIIRDVATQADVSVKSSTKGIEVTNTYGKFFEKELAAAKGIKVLDKIIVEDLGDNQLLWEVVPDVDNTMCVKINAKNEIYKQFYAMGNPDRRITALMDAMLIAIGYTELSFKTEATRAVFEAMNRSIGHLMNRLIENKIIK